MNIKDKFYSSVKIQKTNIVSIFILSNAITAALFYLVFLIFIIGVHLTTQPIKEQVENQNSTNEKSRFEIYIDDISTHHLLTTYTLCKISPEILNEAIFNENDNMVCFLIKIGANKEFIDMVRGEK